MRELIDWVGLDAVRFFFVQRRADSEFTFDIDLALSHIEENPVYYVQYAHARIHSVLRHSDTPLSTISQADTSPLTAPSERALLQRLAEYPAMIQQAAHELAPHQVAFWLRDCASDLHTCSNHERFLAAGEPLRLAPL